MKRGKRSDKSNSHSDFQINRKTLLKSKRSDSHSDFQINRKTLLKSKRSQGTIMGMPFIMIFSILLIVFFIVVAFIAINYFLDFQKTSQVGFFLDDLQDNIDDAWYSSSASDFYFNSTLPYNIDYVCFIDMNKSSHQADPIEEDIFDEIRYGRWDYGTNFIIYPPQTIEKLAYHNIKHIELPEDNPHCIDVIEGEVSIRITKEFGQPLVKVE